MRLLAIATLLSVISTSAFAAPPMMGTSTDPNAVAFKNGSTEVLTINSNGTVSGQTPTANSHLTTKQYVDTQIASNSGGGSTGYFVLSNGQWNGNLGGLAGANAKCLADLTANNWYGKADATLNSATVKAFLCDGSTCQNLNSHARYIFSKSGDTTKGGAHLDTFRDGIGPNDASNWAWHAYFGANAQYHSNRSSSNDQSWKNEPAISAYGHCQNYTISTTADNSVYGETAMATSKRWYSNAILCNYARNLICMVHPQ